MKRFFQNCRPGWKTVFFAALLFHFCCCMAGWNHSLLEHHSYRQSQTAMAVEYMISDHAWINYMTPVLGPPWQVPLEFPLYQWIVAGLCLLLHTPIDQTGRAVSLIFFYASLWPMNLFLRRLVPEGNLRCMMLSLVLFAPVYIYFSRTVMIESTAFFFGFCFLWLSIRQIERQTFGGMAALLICGSLCALVKITTFCAFCFPCLIFPLLNRMGGVSLVRSDKRPGYFRELGVLLPGYAVPLLAGLWWTHRADQIKLASPATAELTSTGLGSWNFGSLAQRLDFQSWMELLARASFGLTFYPLLLSVFLIILFVKARDRRVTGLLLASAVLPVLVFFNLYLVHDYYFYASSIFTIFAIGYLLACLMREGNKWGRLLWLGVAVSFIAMAGFFMFQIKGDQAIIIGDVVKAVQENSTQEEFLLIYGDVWDSRIPYYSKRKAFMNYHFEAGEIARLDAKMERMDGWNKIRLAIVNTAALPVTPGLQQRLVSWGFSEKPDLILKGFSIYRRTPQP